jgi:hypothetical protein
MSGLVCSTLLALPVLQHCNLTVPWEARLPLAAKARATLSRYLVADAAGRGCLSLTINNERVSVAPDPSG